MHSYTKITLISISFTFKSAEKNMKLILEKEIRRNEFEFKMQLFYDVLVIKESMKLLASSIDCVYFVTKNRLIFQERK